ncbi:MAG: YceI family protein [Bacteroidetes bacterium]|nr:YceI family protein [Bacteroidota bacterium]HET6245105.1 YceI family protein [Bacteroidia bacterium]
MFNKRAPYYLFMPVIFVILAFFYFNIQEQERVSVIEVAFITVKGSSNVNKWEMISNQASGSANMVFQNEKIRKINLLEVILPSESFKSGNREMDANAYEALNYTEYPYITFRLSEVLSLTHQADSTLLSVSGILNVAGQSRTIQFDAIGRTKKSRLFFQGSTSFNMTDFNITPPIAMNGTYVTDDQVTVTFDVTYKVLTEPI